MFAEDSEISEDFQDDECDNCGHPKYAHENGEYECEMNDEFLQSCTCTEFEFIIP